MQTLKEAQEHKHGGTMCPGARNREGAVHFTTEDRTPPASSRGAFRRNQAVKGFLPKDSVFTSHVQSEEPEFCPGAAQGPALSWSRPPISRVLSERWGQIITTALPPGPSATLPTILGRFLACPQSAQSRLPA